MKIIGIPGAVMTIGHLIVGHVIAGTATGGVLVAAGDLVPQLLAAGDQVLHAVMAPADTHS